MASGHFKPAIPIIIILRSRSSSIANLSIENLKSEVEINFPANEAAVTFYLFW